VGLFAFREDLMSEDKQFDIYPELDEQGKLEAQKLINRFKKKMLETAEDVLGNLYCDVAVHIETDSWTNYRNKMMDGLMNYGNQTPLKKELYEKLREKLLHDYAPQIIDDLNKDLLDEIAELKRQIESMQHNHY
jgi:uncharacterized protein (DUF488 family)